MYCHLNKIYIDLFDYEYEMMVNPCIQIGLKWNSSGFEWKKKWVFHLVLTESAEHNEECSIDRIEFWRFS